MRGVCQPSTGKGRADTQGDPISEKLRQAEPNCSLQLASHLPLDLECHCPGRCGWVPWGSRARKSSRQPCCWLPRPYTGHPLPRSLSGVMQETGDGDHRVWVIFAASMIHSRQPTLDLGLSSGSSGCGAFCLVRDTGTASPGHNPCVTDQNCLVSVLWPHMEKKNYYDESALSFFFIFWTVCYVARAGLKLTTGQGITLNS